MPIKQNTNEKKSQKLLGVSTDEMEADKSLSGGNLSASNGGAYAAASANAAFNPDEIVMTKIYHSNHCT